MLKQLAYRILMPPRLHRHQWRYWGTEIRDVNVPAYDPMSPHPSRPKMGAYLLNQDGSLTRREAVSTYTCRVCDKPYRERRNVTPGWGRQDVIPRRVRARSFAGMWGR